jgi:hypothetical protein
MTRIAAGGANETPSPRSRPVVQIADEHGDGDRARMAFDGGESYLTEYDRSAYRPADHSRTISNGQSVCPECRHSSHGHGYADLLVVA